MPWKQTEDGTRVEVDGNPVWIAEDGKETAIDPAKLLADQRRLNHESQTRRERIKTLEEQLEPWSALGKTPDEISAIEGELDKLKKAAKKAGEPGGAEDPEGLKARLAELTNAQEETAAKLKTREAELKKAQEAVQAAQENLRRATVGREIRSSKWFSGQNGDKPLSKLHPTMAEDYLHTYGAPDPEDPSRVLWYSDSQRTQLIRDEEGKPAGADYAFGVIGQHFPWWEGYKEPKGATGSGARGSTGDGLPAAGEITKLSQLRTDADKAKYAEKYGIDALERLIAQGQ